MPLGTTMDESPLSNSKGGTARGGMFHPFGTQDKPLGFCRYPLLSEDWT